MFSCSSEAISSANLNSVSIWRLDLLELIFATFCCQGFMIDGFPVDLDQAETFVRDIGHPSKVVLFRANNTVLKGRLLSRWCTASIWSILVHLVAEAVLSYFHQLQLISITKCTKIWCKIFSANSHFLLGQQSNKDWTKLSNKSEFKHELQKYLEYELLLFINRKPENRKCGRRDKMTIF